MDVPAANCVIRFDPMQHAVSLVQGRGRARQADSSFVVLSERSDRSASVLEKTEKTQRDLLSSFDKKMIGTVDLEKERVAQRSRERGAMAGIIQGEVDQFTALSKLNLFCTKTKVPLQCSQGGKKSDYETFLVYTSVLRSVTGRGTGSNKKEAKRAAALDAVILLREDLASNP